jgi:RNA polymerase sigma-70 factor (ECF subfamily)
MAIEIAAADLDLHGIEPENFNQLVSDHQKQIYRILFCLVRDSDAADTLTQECFLRAYRSLGSFRGESGLATWLVRIAINLANDHNRSQRWAFWRRLTRTDRIDSIQASNRQKSPEQALIDSEAVKGILSSVARLPGRQRTAFMLRYVEEMPLEAIAEAMNLEIGTVKSHLSRALNAVRNSATTVGHKK